MNVIASKNRNRRRGRTRMRPAMTLVELLAASALAAALMVAALHVIRAIGRPPVSLIAADASAPHVDVRELIRFDLANAYSIRPGRGTVQVAGYVALDGAGREPTHRPAVVTYVVRSIGGRRCLTRAQSPLGDRTGDRGWSDVVAWDVAAFAVEAVPRPETSARDDALAKLLGPGATVAPRPVPVPSYLAALPGFFRVPDSVRVSLALDGPSGPAATASWEVRLR